MNRLYLQLCFIIAAVSLWSACKKEPVATSPSPPSSVSAPTNRMDVPSAVRQNLGITFAKVESRPVGRTLRLPGRFELLPTAVREYRAASRGRIELVVQQHAQVSANDALYRLDTPVLREAQQQLAESDAAVKKAQATMESIPRLLEAHDRHHHEIEESIALWTSRIKQLTDLKAAGGGRAEELAQANASLSQSKIAFAETLEKEAELASRKSEAETQLAAAKRRFDLLIAALSSLTGEPEDALRKVDPQTGTPRWQAIKVVEVRASAAGIVESLGATHGAWVDESQNVMTVIAPDQLRFRARGFQSDLGRFANGQPAQVVPPTGTTLASTPNLAGKLQIAPKADAESRTIDLFVQPESTIPWAKAGVAGFLEVVVAGAETNDLAIPLSSVVRDGLKPIIFRRDPRAPDKVIRMEADLGIDDGRWIVVSSGVKQGDEVVLDGAFQLLVATSGSIQKGGHFHPDGTFHEGDQ